MLPDHFTSGCHEYIGTEEVQPGDTALARITLLAPEEVPRCLRVGQVVDVHEGSRLVGRARVTRIMNALLDRDAPGRS